MFRENFNVSGFFPERIRNVSCKHDEFCPKMFRMCLFSHIMSGFVSRKYSGCFPDFCPILVRDMSGKSQDVSEIDIYVVGLFYPPQKNQKG